MRGNKVLPAWVEFFTIGGSKAEERKEHKCKMSKEKGS